MKNMIRLIFTLLLILPSFVYSQPLKIVTSFSILTDMVQQIGGQHVQVTTLVDINGDPHVYVPTPQDSVALHHAQLVFVNGLGLEGWMKKLVIASGYQGQLVTASSGIQQLQLTVDHHHLIDPHAWNSAKNAEIYAKNIIQALITAAPEFKQQFQQRGNAYIAKLQQLDSWAKQTFEAVPVDRRKVLTSHNAFGYFADRYHVQFISPIGLSTQTEANAAKIAQLIQQITQLKIHTYFIENQTDPRLVEQIASATGATSGGHLYPEALTDKDGEAPTYVDAFKHNVAAMAKSMK